MVHMVWLSFSKKDVTFFHTPWSTLSAKEDALFCSRRSGFDQLVIPSKQTSFFKVLQCSSFCFSKIVWQALPVGTHASLQDSQQKHASLQDCDFYHYPQGARREATLFVQPGKNLMEPVAEVRHHFNFTIWNCFQHWSSSKSHVIPLLFYANLI